MEVVRNNRLRDIDFASGIMILWMILFHAIGHAWWNVYPCVKFPYLYFFMPWFFYKSGMFFIPQTIREQLTKDSRKLLKPFIIWSVIGVICYIFVNLINSTFDWNDFFSAITIDSLITGKFPINTPLWFLLSLFIVHFVVNLFAKINNGLYLWLLVILGYFVSYTAYKFNHQMLPFWVANSACGICFYVLGYLFRELEKCWWIILPCAIVYILSIIFGFPIVDMFPNKLVSGLYPLYIPVSFCSIVTFNALCRFISKYIHFMPIYWISKNAMTILVTHVLIIKLTISILGYFNIYMSSFKLFSLFILEYVLILPICCLISKCGKQYGENVKK